MSRISKYLNQQCDLEKAQRDENNLTILNTFGDVLYEEPVQIRCRRETFVKDVQTETGAILRSNTRYFTDENIPILADDKLDGKTVMKVEEYTDVRGKCIGYESYV